VDNFYQKIKDGEIDLTVYVYRRPNMRDEGLEYELYIGRSLLDNIFEKFVIDETITEATFSFPENWTNIIEQRCLFSRLFHYYPNLKKVVIKTQSVYIIQCTPAGCCRIVQCPGEENGLPDEQQSIDTKLYSPMVMNIVNPKQLNVFGGSVNQVIDKMENV
jgi:hypothetical protein